MKRDMKGRTTRNAVQMTADQANVLNTAEDLCMCESISCRSQEGGTQSAQSPLIVGRFRGE